MILLVLVILLLGGAILAWFLTAGHGHTLNQQTEMVTSSVKTSHALDQNAFPPPAISLVPQPSTKPNLHALQIGVEESAVLERQNSSWMKARGCNDLDPGANFFTPRNALRLWTLNNDLTAANSLGFMLLLDASHDGRPEAKKVLWQAILQGSICALRTYDTQWLRAKRAQRKVVYDSNGKSYVHYSLATPKTTAATRLAIMNSYAWDLVYEIRTGTPPLGGGSARAFEQWYHFNFQPTAAEYAYACQRANDLYQTLQSERDAQDLGPFDNSPAPIVLRFGDQKPVVDSHCTQWPVPRPGWQAADLHLVQRNGEINPFAVWLPAAENSNSSEKNQ